MYVSTTTNRDITIKMELEKILNILDTGIATAIVCRKQLSVAIKTMDE
jgi:hypothetical protein